ncbi:MAG: hypothetical protein LBJ23_08105 [Tannerella sp.]|jgi:hypothetical protein|nr:hypothetical protein [Tannerella sp.]
MFYARINKIKVFNNREGFLGLFNRAEMRIYGYAAGYGGIGDIRDTEDVGDNVLTLSDLMDLPDEAARKQRLLEAVQAEAGRFAQSASLAVDRVKDNQSLLFGEAGLVMYRHDAIPDWLSLQLWVIESDEDVRRFTLDADKVVDSDAFRGLLIAVETALTVTQPVLSGIIGVGAVAVNLLRQKLKANKDDLVGYWQLNLNRTEHYPHGLRDRQDTPDITGNILVDYTLFGYENSLDLDLQD